MKAWAQALLDPQAALPPGLRAWNGSNPRQRFDVHRNTVVSSLIDALAQTFVVTQQLVGEAFFRTLARQFVVARPPRSPVLWTYGDELPDFIAAYAPAQGLPYLADVARLEHARVLAFHAADAQVMSHEALARQLADPDALPHAKLGLHPSVQVLASPHSVVSIWAAHQRAGTVGPTAVDHPEAALVLRAGDDVLVQAIEPACAAWIEALKGGHALADAIDAAAQATPDAAPALDLRAAFALLITHGAICAWIPRRP
jgi:hypothetical protein